MAGLGTESLFVQGTPDAFEVLLKVTCLHLTCREQGPVPASLLIGKLPTCQSWGGQ